MKNQNNPFQVMTFLGPLKSLRPMNMKDIAVFGLFSLFSFAGISQVNDLPIFTEKLKRGIYKNFEEFINNDPIFTDSFYVESKERKRKNWKGTSSLTPRFGKNGKKIKNAWGFCDGNTVFIFHQKEFFSVEIDDSNMFFYGYGDINNSSTVGERIMMGGGEIASLNPIGIIFALPVVMAGGIVAASTASSYKKHKIKYSINPRNGTIH